MKILVAVKRVIDYNVQVRVKEDGTGVVTENVKMSSNPPDDNAIEEAVKIKEAGKATEIIAITVGEEKSQETVRKALAVPNKTTKKDGNRRKFIENGYSLPPVVLDESKPPVRVEDDKIVIGGLN